LGEYQRALEHWRAAELLAERLDDRRRLSRMRGSMAQVFYTLGRHDEGVQMGLGALALADDLEDDAVRIGAMQVLALNYRSRGDYRRASQLQSDIAALREQKPSLVPARTHTALGGEFAYTLTELGSFREAMLHGEESMRLAQADGTVGLIGYASFYLGTVYLYRGLVIEAMSVLERSVALCESAEMHSLFPGAATRLAAAYTLDGRIDEATLLAERAVASGRTGERPMRATALGEAYLAAGRLDEAHQHADRARAGAVESGERGYQAWALRLLGMIGERREPPDLDEAEARYREALALAEELELRPLQAHCHLGLGKLYRRTGRLDEARRELTTTVEMLREMGMTFWLPEAEAELAQLDIGQPA